jgi:succinyl-diaminopimelate desuccinylase
MPATPASPLPGPAQPSTGVAALDLEADIVTLTAALCDIESVSGHERSLCDAIEAALAPLAHLSVTRVGNSVVARTDLGRAERVLLAGHIDTVPVTLAPPNLPVRRDGADLVGRGTVDMKGGVAVQLKVARLLEAPSRDITLVFYECEEVDSERNGLRLIAGADPALLEADFAVLLEPTSALIEGGCNGTLRAEVTARGVAAHSARPWRGRNAIHEAGAIISRLTAYEPMRVEVDGLHYQEAMNATGIRGGIAGNVIPDSCVVTVNYRYAPSTSEEEAAKHVADLFAGYDVCVVDNAGGARPGLRLPAAEAFVAALGLPVKAKQGWTDVARFSAMGVPAVNFGPGDPSLAHHDDERCPVAQLTECEAAMLRWLA